MTKFYGDTYTKFRKKYQLSPTIYGMIPAYTMIWIYFLYVIVKKYLFEQQVCWSFLFGFLFVLVFYYDYLVFLKFCAAI